MGLKTLQQFSVNKITVLTFVGLVSSFVAFLRQQLAECLTAILALKRLLNFDLCYNYVATFLLKYLLRYKLPGIVRQRAASPSATTAILVSVFYLCTSKSF